jgi:xanthine dehydrogenase YagT iron-sulfur-binding subunit
VAGAEALEASQTQGGAKTLGPGKVPISLRINGVAKTLNLEPRVTLLEALRDELELTGAKKVCDRGVCGACTVLVNGKAAYACAILAIDAQGKNIATVEGLTQEGRLHSIQQAFVDNDAQQCGYCTPGFVVACEEFLSKHPNPTVDQIKKGLGGNLCRCGTYAGITRAVLQAAKERKGGQTHA